MEALMGDLFPSQRSADGADFTLFSPVSRRTAGRVVNEIVYVIRHDLRWKDAPRGYGPPKTLYNRFICWSRMGVFDRKFATLAAKGLKPERFMIGYPPQGASRRRAF
jgi:transposase